jgi:hypothetical protein
LYGVCRRFRKKLVIWPALSALRHHKGNINRLLSAKKIGSSSWTAVWLRCRKGGALFSPENRPGPKCTETHESKMVSGRLCQRETPDFPAKFEVSRKGSFFAHFSLTGRYALHPPEPPVQKYCTEIKVQIVCLFMSFWTTIARDIFARNTLYVSTCQPVR